MLMQRAIRYSDAVCLRPRDPARSRPGASRLLVRPRRAHPECLHHKQIKFRSPAEFDAAVREDFAADHDAAAAGTLTAWKGAPYSALALVMELDRCRATSLFDARAFAGDPLALAATNRALERGFDQKGAASVALVLLSAARAQRDT